MITQAQLKELVEYDPLTGVFTTRNSSVFNRKSIGDRVGTLHKTKGYRYLSLEGKTYREHRIAFLYMTGAWPVNQVDHINQVKEDNRWENLRDVTAKENCGNRPIPKTNRSGHLGVCWNKAAGKWQAQTTHEGKRVYLGLFDQPQQAEKAIEKFHLSF